MGGTNTSKVLLSVRVFELKFDNFTLNYSIIHTLRFTRSNIFKSLINTDSKDYVGKHTNINELRSCKKSQN